MDNELEYNQSGVQNIDNINYDDDINQKEIQLGAPNDPARKKKKKKKKKKVEDGEQGDDQHIEVQQQEEPYIENKEIVESALDSFRATSQKKKKKQDQGEVVENLEQNQDALDQILQEQQPQIVQLEDGNYQQAYYDQNAQQQEQINNEEGSSPMKKKKKKKKKKPVENQEGMNSELMNPEYNQESYLQQSQYGVDQGINQSEQKVDIDNLIYQLQDDQQQQDHQKADDQNILFTADNYQSTLPNNTLVDTEQNELVPTKTKKKKKKKKPTTEQEGEYDSRVVLQVDSINNLDEYGNPRSDTNFSPEKQRIIMTAEKHNVNRDKIIFEEEQKDLGDDFNQSMHKGVNQSLVYGNTSQLNESLVQDDQNFINNYNQSRQSSRIGNQPIILNQEEDQEEQFQIEQTNQMNSPYGNDVPAASEYRQSAIKRLCSKFWNGIQYEKSTQPFEEKSTLAKFFSPNPQLLRPKAKALNISFGSSLISQSKNNVAPANHKFFFILYTLWQILLKKINVYFFFLGVVASVIYWENTRNFGCMIALYIFSVFSQLLIDYNLKKKRLQSAKAIDSQIVHKSQNGSFTDIKRGDLRQGDIVKVKVGELLPADLLLVVSSSEDLFINLDSHGTQAGFDRKYVPSEIRSLDKASLISNGFGISGNITSTRDTLSTPNGIWEGFVTSSAINSGNQFKITEENIGIKNSKLVQELSAPEDLSMETLEKSSKNVDFIIGIVIFHTERSKYNGVNFNKEVFYHPLNSFINLHVFVSFTFIILFAIIFCILGGQFADEAKNSYPYLKKVDQWFKVFMNYVVILTSLLPIFLYPVMGAIDLVQAFLINRMPDDWDEIIYSQKQVNQQVSSQLIDQEMKPLDIHRSSYEPKPNNSKKIFKGEKEFAESTKKLQYEDEKKNRLDLNKSTPTQPVSEKPKKKEISKVKDIIFDGQKISFLGNLNVVVSDLEHVNERYTEFQGFTAYDIGFDQNNNSHLFDGLGEREIQQVVKLFKFGLMSNGKTLQTREDIALKEYCEKLEIQFKKNPEEDNQYIIQTMNVEERFSINFSQAYSNQRQYQTSYISRQNNESQLLMRGIPEVVMNKMTMDQELADSINLSIKQFRARGYTCQILATKYLDEQFFGVLNNIKEKTEEADTLLESLESNLEYLGLFAFKTFYRDPFQRLTQSSIKAWYLTEQSHSYSQNIFKENSLAPTFRIIQTESSQLMKEIDYQFKLYRMNAFQTEIVKQLANYKIKFNMESDGSVLQQLFQSTDPTMQLFKIKFFTMMLHSQSCVIWNMTPMLKSALISQIKGCISPSLNFLAIGASEKDIPLMQTSDVALAYCREENNLNQLGILPYADGKITNFKQLNYLVLSYGRQHHHKSQQLVKYMIEKSIVFTIIEFFYAFFNMYSGQLFFSNVIYFFFEFMFASWGAAFFYLLDFDIQMYQQMEYPSVYLQGSLTKLTCVKYYFGKWGISFMQGLTIFFITAFTLQEAVDGTGMVMNHGFTQICAIFTVFNLMKYKQIVQSTNISYHYWIMVIDYILFVIVMYILQTTGVSKVSYQNLNKMVAAFFSSTSSFFIFLTIGFICILPEIINLVNERLLKRNPIYQIIGFNYGLYERRGNANVPILTQNYYASQMDNFAKIAPEENKAKLGLKKQVA